MGLTHVIQGQGHHTGRRERQEAQHGLSDNDSVQPLSVVQTPDVSEAAPEQQQSQEEQIVDDNSWVAYGAKATWFMLVAADSLAQRSLCLLPPCGEVRSVLSSCLLPLGVHDYTYM